MTPRIALLVLTIIAGCASQQRATAEAQTASAEVFAESQVESAKTPSVKPDEPPATLAAMFDLQLKRLINDEPMADMKMLPADERGVLSAIVESLSSYRQALKNESSLLSTKTAPLAELSERIRATQPLALPNLRLCKSVSQFGIYEPFEPARFSLGKETQVIIYCEVENFASRAASDARWETKLSYEAVLYADNDAAVSVITKKPTSTVDRCRNKRRDFFLADRLTLPSTLPAGSYTLKVTVVDQLANRVAEKSVDLLVTADQGAKP